ncbi:MAG: M1 family aminopeptidase, partial [Flavobacteriales bacterium]
MHAILRNTCGLLLLLLPVVVSAQRYGDPKEKPTTKPKEKPVEKTEEKPDEKPDEKLKTYFQQEVNYTIKVKLNDVNHTLSGYEEIQYINNSPHTFRHLYFHLWANAYKNNETALAKQFLEAGDVEFHFAEEKDRGYIDSLFFRADGDSIGWKLDEKNIDICKLYLKEVLKPGDTVVITTPFFVKLPSATFSRLGHLNQSYFITQWYPKPAVYDKNGWNQMPYLNQGEFYSEFGSFDVSITLPANYVTGATGDLFQCPEEEKFLEKKYKETLENFKSHTGKMGNITGGDGYPASSTEWKTLRYKQSNVHDFAWFADKRWNVLRGEMTLPETGRLVTTWAMFTNGNSRFWKKSTEYINDAVKYYSKWNGEYPYAHVTAVDGTISAGGGMEYPNITVIGDVSTDISLETVIMHEVGHNWFYGILGSNERKHGWMDEGINSFNEMRYLRTKYPDLKMKDVAGFLPWFFIRMAGIDKFDYDQLYYNAYLLCARQGIDQPIELPSEEFTSVNYGTIMYMKTASSFDFLRSFLGEKEFDKCMHAYFDLWKFRHPQPEDLRRIFEATCKKNLGWFFEGMLASNQYIDYSIKKCKTPIVKSTATFQWMTYEEGIMIKNKGGLAVPFIVQGIKDDTIQQQRTYMGHDGTQILSFPNGNYDRIV